MKKHMMPLLGALLLLLSCTACGAAAAQEDEYDLSALTRVPPAAGSIQIAETGGVAERTALLQQIADKYCYDYPGMTVAVVPRTKDELLADLSAGTGYDLVEVDNHTAFSLYQQGLLLDVSESVTTWDGYYYLSDAAKKVLFYYQDKELDKTPAYVMPHTLYQDVLLLRKDLIGDTKTHELNDIYKLLDYPNYVSLDERVETPLAFYGGTDSGRIGDMFIFSKLFFQEFGNVNFGYFTAEQDGTTIFTLPQAKAALLEYKSFYDTLAGADTAARSEDAAIEDFVAGRSAMLIGNPRTIRACEQALDETQLETIYFPLSYWEDPQDATQVVKINRQSLAFEGWSVLNTSQAPEVAVDFLLFLSNSDNNTKWANTIAGLPIHFDAIEKDEYFRGTSMNAFYRMQKRVYAYQTILQPYGYEAYEAFVPLAEQYYTGFLLGDYTADEVLTTFDEYWRTAFETEGRRWLTKEELDQAKAAS